MVYIIESIEEFNKLILVSNTSIVFFTGRFCQPCKLMNTSFIRLDRKYNKTINFLVVDIDQFEQLCETENINVLPTFKSYKHGLMDEFLIGADQTKLEEFVQKYIEINVSVDLSLERYNSRLLEKP